MWLQWQFDTHRGTHLYDDDRRTEISYAMFRHSYLKNITIPLPGKPCLGSHDANERSSRGGHCLYLISTSVKIVSSEIVRIIPVDVAVTVCES